MTDSTRNPLGPVALDVADRLAAPNEVRTARARLTELGRGAWFDQADATTAQLRQASGAAGGIAGATVVDWVRLTGTEALASWLAGRSASCGHAASPNRPAPVFAFAWLPGTVMCAPCAVRHEEAALRVCDGCGAVGDTVLDAHLVLGPLVFELRTCPDCYSIGRDEPG